MMNSRKHYLILLIWCSILTSCCTVKKTVPITNNQEIRTEIKEVLRDTTIYVEIEKEVVREVIKQPQDTISKLSTKYATSTAQLNNGVLTHTLLNKQTEIPTKIVYKDIVHTDSVYVYKEKPVDVIVEKPYIPKFMWYVTIYAALISGIIIMKIRNKFR